jgi:hypothetical protein
MFGFIEDYKPSSDFTNSLSLLKKSIEIKNKSKDLRQQAIDIVGRITHHPLFVDVFENQLKDLNLQVKTSLDDSNYPYSYSCQKIFIKNCKSTLLSNVCFTIEIKVKNDGIFICSDQFPKIADNFSVENDNFLNEYRFSFLNNKFYFTDIFLDQKNLYCKNVEITFDEMVEKIMIFCFDFFSNKLKEEFNNESST